MRRDVGTAGTLELCLYSEYVERTARFMASSKLSGGSRKPNQLVRSMLQVVFRYILIFCV